MARNFRVVAVSGVGTYTGPVSGAGGVSASQYWMEKRQSLTVQYKRVGQMEVNWAGSWTLNDNGNVSAPPTGSIWGTYLECYITAHTSKKKIHGTFSSDLLLPQKLTIAADSPTNEHAAHPYSWGLSGVVDTSQAYYERRKWDDTIDGTEEWDETITYQTNYTHSLPETIFDGSCPAEESYYVEKLNWIPGPYYFGNQYENGAWYAGQKIDQISDVVVVGVPVYGTPAEIIAKGNDICPHYDKSLHNYT